MSPPSLRRVVITGLGAITPLGTSFEATWKALLRNECGATTLEHALYCQGLSQQSLDREWSMAKYLPCQVAAPVQLSEQDNRTSRFVQFTLLAGKEAVRNGGLQEWLQGRSETAKSRVGVSIGNGMSGVREVMDAHRTLENDGYRRISPHFVPKVLSNSASGRLSIEFGLRGPNLSVSTACAAGSHAIGDGFRCIQYGNADIMLSGGTEASIDPLSMAGFCRLRALSTNFSPDESSRPFDRDRDGFVMGEGAAVLVLEEYQHAVDRGATILAELCGYGLSGDANHITAPDPKGIGAEQAMRMALDQAEIPSNEVEYVNAHATSTPKGDEIEGRAIDRLFSSNVQRQTPLYVSSTKGATGHLLGAAGAIEAAFSVQALVDKTVPPTRNLYHTDETFAFQHVNGTTVLDDLRCTMSNSFGFGGTNASLVFKKL